MPPYSPEFNSIEALWGCIKREVKHRLTLAQGKLEQLQFQKILEDVCDAITPEVQARAADTNNRDYLYRLLGDIIEHPEPFPEDPLPVGDFVVPMPKPVLMEQFDVSRMLAWAESEQNNELSQQANNENSA
jgi:hypothetical protein